MNIYLITNLINNKLYVGREKRYKSDYFGSGKLIIEAIKEFGKENFKKEILIDNIDSWEECAELEAVCKLSFNTMAPNGYNKTWWEYPIPIEILIEATSKGGKRTHELYPEKFKEWGEKAAETNKRQGTAVCDPKIQSMGGKIGGKKAAETNKRNGAGFYDKELQSRLGKKGGKIGGKKIYELKIGIFAPENRGMGGKMRAHILFEIDGIIQQMTLGAILNLDIGENNAERMVNTI